MTDRPMYLTTGIIEPEVMNTMPRETARLLFAFQAADLKARGLLLDLAEAAFNEGMKSGSAHLVNAQVYLTDRAKFQKFMETEIHPGEGFALLNGIDHA